MARQLTQQGEFVELVAMFDAANPAYLRRFSKLELMIRRGLFWGHKTKMLTKRLVRLSPRNAAHYLWERVESLKHAARRTFWRLSYKFRDEKTQEVSEELKDASAVVYLAARAYQPGPYEGRVALFRSALEPMSLHRDPKLGWKELIPQIEVEEIPGDHRQILEEPAVAILARAMNDRLVPSASFESSKQLTASLTTKDAIAKA
jgi:thioesterase domain-containing protein